MTDFRSTQVDHIPIIWSEPENLTELTHLIIWIDGLTGNKERMKPYLANQENIIVVNNMNNDGFLVKLRDQVISFLENL